MKYSKDGVVLFDDKNHTYLNLKTGKNLDSVTKYLSQFKNIFDSDKIAKAYAKKHNLKKEDVLLDWKNKGRDACDMGTFVHKIFEDYTNGIDITVSNDYPKSIVANNFLKDIFYTGKLKPIESEYIVYNNSLAGQVDSIVMNNKGEFFILDYKTSREIVTQNKWQNMLGEFSMYQDCNYVHYSIQLRKYQSMVLEYNIKDCYIVHIDVDDYKFYKALNVNIINNEKS